MKNLIKKTIIVCLMFTAVTIANAQVEVNSTNFPDRNFRNYIFKQYYGSDGVITAAEINATTLINVSGAYIENLTGIEHFTALESLLCSNNQLSLLDVSGLTYLHTLDCNNQSPTLTLVGAAGNYSIEIELNEPTETVFVRGVSYKNNKLISTSSGIGSTSFEVAIAGSNQKMSGEITLLYENIGSISVVKNENIKIYPNPVKDELRIESGDLKIESVEILDLSGKKISTNSIDVSPLPQGIYFVKLETEKGIVTKKIIKE
jgi:hypothetical protein